MPIESARFPTMSAAPSGPPSTFPSARATSAKRCGAAVQLNRITRGSVTAIAILWGILRSQLPSGIASACASPSRVGFIAIPASVLARSIP